MLQQTATLLERAIQLVPTNAVYVTEVCVCISVCMSVRVYLCVCFLIVTLVEHSLFIVGSCAQTAREFP